MRTLHHYDQVGAAAAVRSHGRRDTGSTTPETCTGSTRWWRCGRWACPWTRSGRCSPARRTSRGSVARAPRPAGPAADRPAGTAPPGRRGRRGCGRSRDARGRRPPRPDPRGDHGGRNRQQLRQHTDTPMPDPTFYRSPADASRGPPEKLAYVVAFDRAAQRSDALVVLDVDPASPRYGQIAGWTELPTAATSCTTSAGTRAAARSPTPGTIPTGCSAGTCCYPGFGRPTSTSPTRSRTRRVPGSPGRSARKSWRRRRATPARTPSTAARTGSSCPASAGARCRRPGRHRAA